MIEINLMAGALGAEILGVDLNRNLEENEAAQIRSLLLEHQVIFFRDQNLEPARHKALAGASILLLFGIIVLRNINLLTIISLLIDGWNVIDGDKPY